jgi:signal peptidase I
VIGIGGDTISFEDGVLSINGKLVREEIQDDRSELTDMGDQSQCNSGDGKNLFIEKLNDDSSGHYILRNSRGGYTNNETKVWTVPAKQLLVVGDNRDCSNDGRFWGFVDVNKIYGKAVRVFYSIDTSRGGFPAFRGDRFFTKLK